MVFQGSMGLACQGTMIVWFKEGGDVIGKPITTGGALAGFPFGKEGVGVGSRFLQGDFVDA